MANTIVANGHTISITFDGSTPWNSIAAYASGLLIESMEFKPTATDDAIAVRDTDANGAFIFHELAASAYDNKIKYFNSDQRAKRFFPYIVGNEVSAGAILIFELK